ncbi:MAG: IS1 family transposase [Candidatus Polarisedimenticolia bacterium]
MYVLAREKQIAVITALTEGCSIRSVERMTGVHRDTIMRLAVRVGEACAAYLDANMRNLQCEAAEVDEAWSYVWKKQGRLTAEEKRNPEIGDQYVFIALDPKSKAIIAHEVGKRDGTTAKVFIHSLQSRLARRIQLSSDSASFYPDAVWSAWANEVDYGMITKVYEAEHAGPGRYAPPRVTEVISTTVYGSPVQDRICTSYVERQNLNLRMACRRFTRLTLAFSKRLRSLKAAVALYAMHTNFVKIHRTTRCTAAMELGIAQSPWTVANLVDLASRPAAKAA